MPIYEFKCTKCKIKFEEIVRGKEKIKCPKCGCSSVNKLFSSFSSFSKDSGGKYTATGGSPCGSCKPSPTKCGVCK